MDTILASLIKEYSGELTKLCNALCTSRQDAEDLFQITWEKVLRGYKKYDSSRPFDKWLWTVCVNAYKDILRNPFRRKTVSFSSNEEMELVLLGITDTDNNRDEYIALHSAINRLDPKKRQVIALYYFRDYTTAELAEILSIPEGTVKSRLSSAKEQLRKELFDE